MLELIDHLRQLCEDNEDGALPVLLVQEILSQHEAKLAFEYAARTPDGEILREGDGPQAAYGYAQRVVREFPGRFDLVRRSVVPEQYGPWTKLS